jgi:pimeloyl-ACP methyl ester carboxylesterase
MDFMISLRDPRNPKRRTAPRYLVIDDGAAAPVQLGLSAWASRVIAQFPPIAMKNPDRVVRTGDILFLVHGFNVDSADALKFHHVCASSLRASGWQGVVISYDWPSDGLVFAYLPDREDARDAASKMIRSAITVLQDRQAKDCTINVHVMAHSMGAFVTQQAFTNAYQDVPKGWRVGQVLLVSGDVDHTVFSAEHATAKAFVEHAGRLTCYTNRRDKALLASNVKRLALAPRVGRVGLPEDSPRPMVEVNCTGVFEALPPTIRDSLDPSPSHSFYFGQRAFWDDVVLTLNAGLDRSDYPNRVPQDGGKLPNRFVLGPTPMPDGVYHAALAQATSSIPAN